MRTRVRVTRRGSHRTLRPVLRSTIVRAASGALFLLACSAKGTSTSDAGRIAEASAPVASMPTADAAPTPDAGPVLPRGRVTLVIQKVSSHCEVAAGELYTTFLGHDLFFEVEDGSGAKATKEFVLCPKDPPDGGTPKPKLNIWQMCSKFPKCAVTGADAGDRVEVTCGKEVVVVQTDGRRTWVTGSFGEREIAPWPMTLAPPKRTERLALIDC